MGAYPGRTTTEITPDPTALQTALGTMSVLGGIMNPYAGTQRSLPPGTVTGAV